MEHSIQKKLENLLKLQEIDSKIFEIKKVRGALPEEVQDLEDELVGYNTRLDNFNADIENKNNERHFLSTLRFVVNSDFRQKRNLATQTDRAAGPHKKLWT